ncbi:voltage-gated purine nucleotide uniporter SLC17A9-like [Paralichthys olivaceus]|uniref:voltage-gated purine nucleotide uniporter SLC17A9-like n=1 Tax=Paralichthys olivaceus TaxID=8255 RepID=UPI00097DB93A|nr:PREDICTED: solute carrier family 17 member 9-like [Paralichthys olivaceus]
MADKHTSGDGWNDKTVSLLEHKICTITKSMEDDPVNTNLWPRALARRWTLVLFVGTCLLYCARMAMPICAVSMAATFNWSKIESGLVLGGFFWGYCTTQILGGHASDKVGGERILFISTGLWALVTGATPLLAQLGIHTLALMTLGRFLLGLLQGVFFPSLASICSQRFVEAERAFLMSTMHSGTYLGTLMAGGMGSIMLDKYGWQSMFFFTGFLSSLWALLVWQYFLKDEVIPKQLNTHYRPRPHSQWNTSRLLHLLKKPPVWSMVFAHMCIASTSNTLLSWLPMYFKETFPDAPDWAYNVIPWLVAIPSSFSGGYISDFLINHGYSISSVRKIMQLLAMGGSSMFIMILMGGAFTSFPTAVMFVSAAVGLSTFTSCGVSVNVQDLAPSCAGALFGFMNMMGAFMGVVLVSLTGYLIEVTLTWASVFSLISLVNTTGLVVFLLFGDAQRVDLETYGQISLI